MKRVYFFRCAAVFLGAMGLAGCDEKPSKPSATATSVTVEPGASGLGSVADTGRSAVEEKLPGDEPHLPGVGFSEEFEEQAQAEQVMFELEEVEVTGVYSRAIVERNLGRQEDFVQECYRSQLQDTPGMAGTMTATFDISANGRVSELEFTSEVLPDTMFDCAKEQVEKARFPTPREAVSVTATYELSANRKPKGE